MSESKTEWVAQPSAHYENEWRVSEVECAQPLKLRRVVFDGLDKPTAHKIAAVNELEAACQNIHDWLMDCYSDQDLESKNYLEAFRKAAKTTRAALAKARGET